MNPIQANEAFSRVAATITTPEDVKISGVLEGVLLGDWKFNFINDEGHRVSDKIDDNLTGEQVIALNRQFFNEHCEASLLKTTVLFKNGCIRTTYTLQGLEALPVKKA
jgi:hypothetical protein